MRQSRINTATVAYKEAIGKQKQNERGKGMPAAIRAYKRSAWWYWPLRRRWSE